MKTRLYTLCFVVLLFLMYACTSQEEQRKKKVNKYYETYYQKRDINAVKSLFSADIQYYDDKYKMPMDTFVMIFNFDKKLEAKAQIMNMSMSKDTIVVLEKLTDELDLLLKRPSAQYRKKFIFKGDKISQIISLPYKQEEWANAYLERMQQFFVWLKESHSKESTILMREPYTHVESILAYAKEYAKQTK